MRCSSSCRQPRRIVDEIQEMEGIGRFGWVTDPEGNRIELWEPAPGAEFPETSEKL